MEEKLVTLAIHTFEKAQILKTILESEEIEVFIHNVNQIQPVISAGVRVRIKESDLSKALQIIEAIQFFKEEEDFQEDDGVKKILIPIDFSDYSMRACDIGFEYAKIIGAEVKLFHAYYSAFTPSSLFYSEIGQEKPDKESTLKANNRVQTDIKNTISVIEKKISAGELPEVKYDYIIREGLPEDEIIAYAKTYRPMLIVMGTRGRNRKNLDLIGSVTAEIIEATTAPLLAIPEDISFGNLKEVRNIAFATSFNRQDIMAFERFMKLVGNYKLNIHLFNMSISKDESNEIRLIGMCEYLKKHYSNIEIDYTVLNDGDLLDAIDNFVMEKQIDIIALTTHRRSMITRIFNQSIASRMLFHSNTALLVIPNIS